jgi:hypothetical protein
MVKDRVLVMESISEGRRIWVLMSLEGGISSPKLDTTKGSKHNSVTVPNLEYYYPTYRCDPRLDWDKEKLVEQNTALTRDPGEGHGAARTLCR